MLVAVLVLMWVSYSTGYDHGQQQSHGRELCELREQQKTHEREQHRLHEHALREQQQLHERQTHELQERCVQHDQQWRHAAMASEDKWRTSRDSWKQRAKEAEHRLAQQQQQLPHMPTATAAAPVAAVMAMTDSTIKDDDYLQYCLSQIDEDSDAYAALTGRTRRRRRARGTRGGRRRRGVRAMCSESSANDGQVYTSPFTEQLSSPVGESTLQLESPIAETQLELPASLDADGDATGPAALEASPPGSPGAPLFSPGGTSTAGYHPLTPGIAGRVRERHELARAGYSPFDPGIGGRVRARHEATRAEARDAVGVCQQVQSRRISFSQIPDGIGICSSPLGPTYDEPRDPWLEFDELNSNSYWRLLAICGEASAGGAEPTAGGAEPSSGGAALQPGDDIICMV